MQSVLALLLAIPLVFSVDEQTCYRGSARLEFMDGEPTAFRANGRVQTCPNQNYGCGAVRKFARSIRLSGDREESGYTSRAYSTLDLGCVAPEICRRIVGSEINSGSQCKYADYQWTRYDLMSCNATNNYDAERYRQRVRIYYACCGGDKCADPARTDVTNTALNRTCTENPRLGGYITDLFKCWAKGQLAFRKYFVCDTEGPILATFREECSDDVYGEWDRNTTRTRGESCRYRPTCSSRLQQFLTTFGECACDAATSNNYTGAAIGSLMESLWSNWCPGIELSCSGEGRSLLLRRRRKRRFIKFRIKRKIAEITEAIRTSIRQKIAEYLGREDSTTDITVTSTAASDAEAATRRLLAADKDNESDITVAVDGDDKFDEDISDDACDGNGLGTALGDDITGGTLTSISCESGDVYDTVSGDVTTESPDTTGTEMDPDNAMGIGYVFAVFVSLIGYLMQ